MKNKLHEHIHLNHKVTNLAWSSKENSWEASILHKKKSCKKKFRFVVMGTGYYDEDTRPYFLI